MIERAITMELAKRMLAFHEAGTTEQASEQYRVPVWKYHDPERWQLEMDRIFKGCRCRWH